MVEQGWIHVLWLLLGVQSGPSLADLLPGAQSGVASNGSISAPVRLLGWFLDGQHYVQAAGEWNWSWVMGMLWRPQPGLRLAGLLLRVPIRVPWEEARCGIGQGGLEPNPQEDGAAWGS